MSLDTEYQQRVEAALIAAIVEASLVEHDGQRIAAVRSGEIVEAMVGVLASLISTSDAVATPRGRRLFADEVAKRLTRRIARCRQHAAEHGTPFATMPMEAGRC